MNLGRAAVPTADCRDAAVGGRVEDGVMDAAGHIDAFRALADRRGRAGVRLLEALAGAREETTDTPAAWAPAVARSAGLPAAAGLGPASYYADLTAPHGRRHVRVCAATAC